MKLFFRMKDGRWLFYRVDSISQHNNDLYLQLADHKGVEIYLLDIQSISTGAQAEHDAEVAIRALLPMTEPIPVVAAGKLTHLDNSWNSTADYHVEFHTGETTPPSPPEKKVPHVCDSCKNDEPGICEGRDFNRNTDCSDWEAKV